MNGAQQLFIVKRFKKEIFSAALHCGGVQRVVIPRCNDDHSRSWRELVQNCLNFESIESGH
jgi:hypothetical protein